MTARWGLGDALFGWALGMVGGTTTSLLVAAHLGLEDTTRIRDVSLGWLFVATSGLWIGLLVMPVVATRLKGNGIVRDLGLRARPSDIWVGGGWGVLSQWLLLPLLYLPFLWLTDTDLDELGEPARELSDQAQDAFGIVVLIVFVGLVAPVVEEIFYRGLLQRAMQRRLGTWPGLLLTAVVFGAVHGQLLQLPALIVAGLVFGVLAHRRGRLGPAITAHIAFNMVTVVGLVWLS